MSRAADKRAERLARELADDQLRTVMSTPAGQATVWRIITGMAQAFGPSFSTDPAVAAFNEGKRFVGLLLMKQAQRVAPTSYLQMLNERINADLRALEPQKEDPETEPEPDTSGDSSTDD